MRRAAITCAFGLWLAAAPAPAAAAESDAFAPPPTDGRLMLSFFGAWLAAGALDAAETGAPAPQSPGQGLAWAELRGDVGASGLFGLPVDARLDARVRYDLTGPPPPATDPDGTPLEELPREDWRCGPVATGLDPAVPTDPPRCHELDLREASVTIHPGRLRLSLGRLLLPEAGGIQLDGVRLGFVPAGGWVLGAFGGLVPDLYRRVSFADYGDLVSPGAGLFVTARTRSAWLAASVGAHLLGAVPRVFVFGEAAWRPIAWVDVFAYALLDVTGPEGFILRNATLRVGVFPDARVRFSVSGGHWSALAFREYTTRLFEEAGANDLDLFLTARDELRVRFSADPVRWLTLYAVGRLQRRVTAPDPLDPAGSYVEATIGGTLGVAARDLAGVRVDASVTRLASFQSRSLLAAVRASRDLFGAVTLDAGLAWLHHRDDLGDLDDAADAAAGGARASLTRPVDTITASLTAVATWRNWTLLATYELVHDRTTVLRLDDPADPNTDSSVNPSWTHLLFARAQFRW